MRILILSKQGAKQELNQVNKVKVVQLNNSVKVQVFFNEEQQEEERVIRYERNQVKKIEIEL